VTQARRALGASGEDLVAEWYEARGYRVLDRNWRCRTGELDIVAGRGGLVVFCEVKTRSSVAFGMPAEAVTRAKQTRLRRLGAQWLGQSGAHAGELRFDVACVLAAEVEVIEGAF
jgi:putative endonuclease